MAGNSYPWPDDRNYEPTPYLFDDFIAGNLYFQGDLLFAQLPIRLNLYNDEIEFLRNDSVFVLPPYIKVDQIITNGQVLLFLDGEYNHMVEGIVKTWSTDFPTVLTKMNKFYIWESYKPYVVKPTLFNRVDKHFVWVSEDKLLEVNTVKQLIKALGNSTQLTAFAKEQKISVNNPVELTKLLDHYRFLTEEQ